MWISRPATDHTWSNFKTHFEEAHRLLRVVRGMMMRSSACHHTNTLSLQVLSEVKNIQNSVLQAF